MIGNGLAAGAAVSGGKRARASLALAAALVMLAPGARAQSLLFPREPSPERVEYMLESAGYELRSELARRGDVYLGDVVSESGARERLVIDARTGRILESFPMGMRHWREARLGDWRDPDDAAPPEWGYGGDAPPRPPRPLRMEPRADAGGDERTRPAPDGHAEISPKPNVIYGPDAAAPAADTDKAKAKAKIHVAHKKKPVIASLAPPDKTAPDPVKPLAGAPKPAADGKPALDVKPAAPQAAAPEKPAEEAPKPVAEAKPAPEVKIAPNPEPRPEKKTKPVNDVPVDPLD